MSTQQFQVQGMTCGHCEKAVQAAIRSIDPQADVRIDRSQNLVEVTTDKDRDSIAAAIRDEGYTVAA
ncbi:MAG: heavy-metal-associated domain-containing protein [Gammaproteobacteria bacterium]